MDVTTLKQLLFSPQEGRRAQDALTQAKSAGIPIHNLLDGTLLSCFLEKEITKFSSCSQTHLPHHRYDFRLNEDFSFSMEIMQLNENAATPSKAEDLSGSWELVHLGAEEVVIKLKGTTIVKLLNKEALLKISHENIDWIDKL